MADQPVLPSGGPTREEIAKIEIGHTDVGAGVARALTLFFVACIIIVPAIEIAVPLIMPERSGANVWAQFAGIPRQISAAIDAAQARGETSLWKRALAANRAAMSGLLDFENGIEDESVIGRTLRPPAQLLLSGRLGAGNERVYIGRDGWLFFRPDVEYVTGRGFLEPDVLRRRVVKASELSDVPQPDPRPAILEFHRQLAAQGITLIVMPTPAKPVVHPEKLIGTGAPQVPQNPSYQQFINELRGNGVRVFDPTPVLVDARQSGAQYLATDTHWRPEAMELVAERLAAMVRQEISLPDAADFRLSIEEREVSNAGDTVVMLDLPPSQRRYPPEPVVISTIRGADGSPWRSDRRADVLVLGDSFSNIFSLASMGWGESAGLVEHLSYALSRPIDRIVQNDAGAYATREQLQRSGPERLAGKRVVIWQFAARELASGDWKLMGGSALRDGRQR